MKSQVRLSGGLLPHLLLLLFVNVPGIMTVAITLPILLLLWGSAMRTTDAQLPPPYLISETILPPTPIHWAPPQAEVVIDPKLNGNALKLTKVSVPGYKVKGEMAILECNYTLENEGLYAVKWYKDNEEFYRYVPRLNPPQQSYRVDGIKVDHLLSDSTQVVLRGVNLKSTGLYRCEVSAEAPSFASAHNESRMEVIFLPKDGPHITGEEKLYQIGDELSLNCTSGRSYPESTLHWHINEEQVSDPEALLQYTPIVHTHGLVSSTLGLRLIISSSHFLDGQMRVRCVASVSPVLWQGDRESVVQRVATLVDNREAMLLVRTNSAHIRRTCRLLTPVLLLAVLLSS